MFVVPPPHSTSTQDDHDDDADAAVVKRIVPAVDATSVAKRSSQNLR